MANLITISLTEAELARICYALEAEADAANKKAWYEKKNGDLSVSSGRLQVIHENSRDEALAIVRKFEEVIR